MAMMKQIKSGLLKGAEGVAAAMLAAMFGTFVLQIFSRYILGAPLSWTLELCLTLWIWIVFWGNAFVVGHDEHVTFDVLYHHVQPRTRRIFALITSAAIVIGMAVSLLPTWDYIDFLKIKKSATLRIPLRTIFSIYAVFIIAAVLSYGWRFFRVARYGLSEEHPEIRSDVSGDHQEAENGEGTQ